MRFDLFSLVLAASAAVAACGGTRASMSAPTPSVSTSSATISLTGRVTESAPTPTTGIEGAVVTIGDGPNAVELYVDSSDAWTSDPQLVATGGPLEL